MCVSFRRIGLAVAGAVFLALLLPTTAQAATQNYGSIAYSPSKRVVAAGLAGSKSGAIAAAVRKCRAQGGSVDCWPLIWYHNAVGALARGANGVYGSGVGWSSNVADATKFADRYAIQTCRQFRGNNCKVVFTAHTRSISSSGSGGAAVGTNDYPFKNDERTCDSKFGCTNDGHGFFIRQCTSFVAWRLRSVNGDDLRGPIGKGAKDWGVVYKRITNSKPALGSVAWSRANHVAWVMKVSGRNVTIEEYNWVNADGYHTRTVPAKTFTGYIHFKDL